jgi:arylsulfatase A-like enzyme
VPRALALSALALALALPGCSREASTPRENAGPSLEIGPAPGPPIGSAEGPKLLPEAPKPKARPPYNVLFILVDSLRWDMPWTGYPRPIAPWLDAFAKRSTLYPRSYSLSSYTAQSVAPTLTGKLPSEMHRDPYFFTIWGPENLLFGERAQKRGHRTLAGHGHGYFKPVMGLNQGFDDYRLLPGTELDIHGVENVTSEALNKLAKAQLSDPKNVSQENGERFFAYFHFLDPHYTYIQHKESPDWGLDIRALYDNEVHYTDRWVGDLVDFAQKQPWGKDTAVVISADHGEGFGERGRFRHAYDVWESLIRVPLIIHVPGAEPRRIETPRSHVDLAPTFADLMGVPHDPPYRGKSLVPEVFGGPTELRPVVSELSRCDIMDRRRAVIDDNWKLVELGEGVEWLLFDVVKDPKEENDLAKAEPERFAAMKELHEKLWAAIPPVPIPGKFPLKGAPKGQRW